MAFTLALGSDFSPGIYVSGGYGDIFFPPKKPPNYSVSCLNASTLTTLDANTPKLVGYHTLPAALRNMPDDLPRPQHSGAWNLHPDATPQASCKSPSPVAGCYGVLSVARNTSSCGVVSGGKHSLSP